MTTVVFRTFGPPSLVKNGRIIRLHSSKSLALLAYLVNRAPAPHSREVLIALLWPDATSSSGRQSLRQALYSLRRALGDLAEACLVTDRETVTFFPHSDFETDKMLLADLGTTTALTQQTVDDLLRAVELYRGPYLEGIALGNAPDFEEWLLLERERFTQRASRLMQAAIDRYLTAGQGQSGLPIAHRLLGLDNLNEAAHRSLMRIFAAMGDPDAVRRQYRLCANILLSELGEEPAAETTALRDELVAGTAAAVTQPAASGPPASIPFLGCEELLAQLSRCLDGAIAGQQNLAFVVGESGSGKTRIVREFVHMTAGQRPLQWLECKAYEAEIGAPYAIWSDVATTLASPQWQRSLEGLPVAWRQQLLQLAPGRVQPAEASIDLSTDDGRLRLMQSIVHCLMHLTQRAPLVLFFDDIHWADAPSLQLLHYVVRHLYSAPVMVIAAYSPEEIPDSARRQALEGIPHCESVEVAPATEADVEGVLESLGVTGLPITAAELLQRCGGNRFMFIETIRMLTESPDDVDGPLANAGNDNLPLPESVRALVRARIADLSDAERRLLAAQAVIGRPCGPEILQRVSGLPEMSMLEQISHLYRRGFLSESTDDAGQGVVSFSHDIVREVIHEDMGVLLRQALHRRAAEDLLAQSDRLLSITPHEEIALHYEQAGSPQAIDHLKVAAERAASLFALPHATVLYERALQLAETHYGTEYAGRFALLLALESLLDEQGQRSKQAYVIADLMAVAEASDAPGKLAIAYLRRAGYLGATRRVQQALAASEQALALYHESGDGPGEALALRELGFLTWTAGNYGVALDYGRSALQLHRRLGDLPGEATALHNLAEIYRGLQSPQLALAHYRQALELQWVSQDHRRQGISYYGMAHAYRQLDNTAAALKSYMDALTQTQKAGDALMSSRVHHALGTLYAQTGDLDSAIDSLQRAVDISDEIGYAPGLAHGLVGLSYLHTLQGQRDVARESLLDSLTWFELMTDHIGEDLVRTRLIQLEQESAEATEPPPQLGWIRTNVTLQEGKVYCEFESPR